jgi:hypothetical protein
MTPQDTETAWVVFKALAAVIGLFGLLAVVGGLSAHDD